MSEEDRSYLSVLLPTARVDLFTQDDATKEAFQSLEGDWRYARVTQQNHSGGVEEATAFYSANQAPELVIIQTEDIDESFTGKLEALAAHLSENTSAIIIGPVNDVNLYKRLANMGVSDYLVKPIDGKALSDCIASTLIEQIGVSDSRLIAFVGAKGGVGTTSITEALAWHLADSLGQKTFLLDTAGGWSTLSVGMDFEPSTTLAEAVKAAANGNEDSLSRMVFSAHEKLSVLSSGGDVMLEDHVEADQFEILLEYLMTLYPVVMVDLSASPALLRKTVLTKAHMTYLVTTPVLSSVRAARTLLQEIKQIRGGDVEDVEVVLNMQNYASKSEVSKSQIQDGLGKSLNTTIPFSPDLFVSTESQAAKLEEVKAGEEIVRSLASVLLPMLAITPSGDKSGDDKKGGLGQILNKLKAKS